MTQAMDRRTFHKQAAAMSALAALPSTHVSALGSNERVRLGVIGVGNRGDQLLDALLVHKDCEIAALCDVYEPYLHAAQKKVGGKTTLYHDFRKLIEQKDLDAVVISHLHLDHVGGLRAVRRRTFTFAAGALEPSGVPAHVPTRMHHPRADIARVALRKKFDRQAFNDFVLAQGMLPPALLRKAVMEEFVPAALKQ